MILHSKISQKDFLKEVNRIIDGLFLARRHVKNRKLESASAFVENAIVRLYELKDAIDDYGLKKSSSELVFQTKKAINKILKETNGGLL